MAHPEQLKMPVPKLYVPREHPSSGINLLLVLTYRSAPVVPALLSKVYTVSVTVPAPK